MIVCMIGNSSNLISVVLIEDILNENFSPRQTASIIMANKGEGDMIVNFRCIIQGLPFYVKERVVLVQKKREVQFEEDLNKEYYIEEMSDFLDLISREKVWIMAYAADFKELKEKTTLPLKVYWEKSGFVLFSNVDENKSFD